MVQQVLLNTWAQVDAAVDIIQASGLGANLTLVGATNPEIKGGDADGVLTVTCDAAAAAGGNLRMFGGGHATQADDVEIRGGATVALHYDDSASLIDLQANGLQTTGTAALGVTTITGNLNTDDVLVGNGQGMVVGHDSFLILSSGNPEFQILGTGGDDSQQATARFSADAVGPIAFFCKSRAAIGAQAIIVTGDSLGSIAFLGDDGVDYATLGASIIVTSEGTIGADRIPAKMQLRTGTDAGPSILTTALTLDSAQLATFAAGITLAAGIATLPNGVVGAPSLVWDGSLTTGLFQSGADIVNIANAGVETIEFGALNTIGIGVTPVATTTLTVRGAGADNPLAVQNASGSGFFNAGNADQSITTGANAADHMMLVNRDTTTSRSINASGTLNASGADYAEYEFKAPSCGVIAKGDIIGFDSDGLITDRFSDSVSFAIKSTDPSYVGGDRWGTEAEIGARPEKPAFVDPGYPDVKKPRKLHDEPTLDTEEPIDPGAAPLVSAIRLPEETDESYAIRQQAETAAMALWAAQKAQYDKDLPHYERAESKYQTRHAAWEAAKVDYDDALGLYDAARAEYNIESEARKTAVEDAMPAYDSDLATWKAGLETARQSVDRIAYAGKVPCNVTGGDVGEHVIPISGAGDSIGAATTLSPTAAQHRMSVGRIKAIDATNRVFVIVKMG